VLRLAVSTISACLNDRVSRNRNDSWRPKAITIARQVSLVGATPSVSTTQYAADEWIMPPIEAADATSGITGSGTTIVGAIAIPERAGGSAQTANCTWQFTNGAAPQTQHATVVTIGGTLQPSVGAIGMSGSPKAAASITAAGARTLARNSPVGGSASPSILKAIQEQPRRGQKFTSNFGSAAGGRAAADTGTSVASGGAGNDIDRFQWTSKRRVGRGCNFKPFRYNHRNQFGDVQHHNLTATAAAVATHYCPSHQRSYTPLRHGRTKQFAGLSSQATPLTLSTG
jgi:hypothetical protein